MTQTCIIPFKNI